MVFPEGSYQTIVLRNVVPELVRISVDVSEKSRVHTVGYVKQGVGVGPLNGTGLTFDQSHDV